MSSLSNKEVFLQFNDSLKRYSSRREVLKNNIPLKYLLTNHNLFIHITYWIFFFWFLTVLVSILVPVNNTYLFGRGVKVVFETAFNYIIQTLYKSTPEGLGAISTSVWTKESYIFLIVSLTLLFIGWYCVFCVQNFLLDFLEILKKYDQVNSNTVAKFRKGVKLFFIWSAISILFTLFALLYIKTTNKNMIKTIIFAPFDVGTAGGARISGGSYSSEDTRTYTRSLTYPGFFILFNNILIFITSTFLYFKYSASILRNNRFFFKFIEKTSESFKEAQNFLDSDPKIKQDIERSMHASFGNYKKKNSEGYVAELKNINKYFQVGNRQFHALKDINLKIKKGEFIVILGPSGSGKTTLLNILAGIDRPTNGDIVIGDCDTSKMSNEQLNLFRRKKIGYIFQNYSLLPTLTAKENIMMAQYLIRKKEKNIRESFNKFKEDLSEEKNIFAKLKIIRTFVSSLFFYKEDSEKVNYLLDVLNLQEHINKYPHQLSGGQQQRVAIARAFIKNPQILFGDEPTGAIDHAMSKSILELFYLINKYSKTTVIIITHNPLIAQMAKRVLYISEGRISKDVINLKPKLVHEIKGL